ncbi:MAG: hypothetical protein IIA09_19640, partial [Proteobacteria bacterium]|nr:hypothetical protein [Pseudomonadota bacterium]
MSALPLISELSDKGIRIRVDGPDLVLSPKKALTPNLVSRLKNEKPALIQSLKELRRKAGADWEEIAGHPDRLKAFTELLMIVKMRENGITPDHYTSETECKQCGPVPIFEGCPSMVAGCPWCFNRHRGLPIPKSIT